MALGLKRDAPKGWAQFVAPSLLERAAEIMRSAILAGRLKPGQRLIEYTLASDLRIGQPTLREALKRLEYEGFVQKIPKKGTYVLHLTKEDCRKMLEVRTRLELLAVTMATRNVDEQGKTELEGAAAMMECAASSLDYRAFHEADLAFHRKIWEISGNEYFSISLERIIAGLFAFVLMEQVSADHATFVAAQVHRSIARGICSGDPEQARQAFVANTLGFWSEYHQVEVDRKLICADLSETETTKS